MKTSIRLLLTALAIGGATYAVAGTPAPHADPPPALTLTHK